MRRWIQDTIEWRRMKKLALDHPFFDRKENALTARAARALLNGHPIPTGKDVLHQARIACGVPLCAGEAEPIGKDGKDGKDSKDVSRGMAHGFRRAAVPLAGALVIVGFFTLTKPGAALAQGLYEVVVRVFGGTLMAQGGGMPAEVEPIDFSALPSRFNSLEEIVEATGRTLIRPAGEDGAFAALESFLEPVMLVVRTQYVRQDGASYMLTQTLFNGDTMWASVSSLPSGEAVEITLPIGLTAYLGTMEDGTVFADAYGAGYVLHIASTEVTLEELEDLILRIEAVS